MAQRPPQQPKAPGTFDAFKLARERGAMEGVLDVAASESGSAKPVASSSPAVLPDSGDQARSDALVSRIIADNLGQHAIAAHASP